MNVPGSNSQSETKMQAWGAAQVWLLTWDSYLNSELQSEIRDHNRFQTRVVSKDEIICVTPDI